jgi:NAD(P)-dependent dehydrogenase (short-subunit alcohol dehydrogenase family)
VELRCAVVTGASSGVGKAVALRLSGMGYRVFGWARNPDRLDALQAEGNGGVMAMPVDVTRAGEIEQAYARIESEHGPIELLVNNAGVFQVREFVTQDLSTIDRILDTTLKGTVYCTRLLLPYMISRKRGRIINIASVGSIQGVAGHVAYCAAKHGVIGFAEAVAQEALPHGILVTTLCPGGIDTPAWRSGDSHYPLDLDRAIKVEEVADLVAYLLAQPDRTLFKRIIFFPTIEWWNG